MADVIMANVIIISAAEADYTESLCWYAERNVDAANEFDAEFDRAIMQIGSDPVRFPLCDDRHRYYLMRRFPFQVIYRIHNKDVLVIAVAHTSRAPDFWTKR